MNIIEEALNNVKVLNGWEGMNVLPEIEEKPEDIWMLIKYDNHGDEFIVVGTRDGKRYEYGLYLTRKYCDFIKYLRKPTLYKSLDEYAHVSNEIFFEFERAFKESHMSFGYNKRYYSPDYAQRVFERELDYISSLAETSNVVVDYDSHKNDIYRWLGLNGIDSEENIKKLENTKFTNKVGEHKIIGVAGKTDISNQDGIVLDNVEFICINRKRIDPEKVLVYYGSDEWGFDSQYLSFKGFRQSKVRAS